MVDILEKFQFKYFLKFNCLIFLGLDWYQLLRSLANSLSSRPSPKRKSKFMGFFCFFFYLVLATITKELLYISYEYLTWLIWIVYEGLRGRTCALTDGTFWSSKVLSTICYFPQATCHYFSPFILQVGKKRIFDW